MKSYKHIIILLLLLSLISSCVSSRQTIKTIPAHVPHYFTSGEYLNNSTDSTFYNSLLQQITHRPLSKKTIDIWSNLKVNLTRLDKKILVEAYDGDSLVDTRNISGKWKDSSFVMSRLVRPIGIPCIWFNYYARITVLSFTETEVVVTKGECRAGMILIMAAGNTEYTWRKYAKIK